MYWFRESFLAFIPWLLIMVSVGMGGWMIVSRMFSLEAYERVIAGFGFGLVFYLFLTNICGYIFNSWLIYGLPGLLVFAFGLALVYRERKTILDWKDFTYWKPILVGLVLLLVVTRIEQGLTISDDPKNLTFISRMAAGDIPPHYLRRGEPFSYHYGFLLLGASMMRLGNAMPWSSFDISKAIVFTFTLLILYLIAKRYVKARYGAVITVALYSFFGGTRWLFFLLPLSRIKPLDQLIQLQGTSALMNVPFTQAIYQLWTLDGGPPLGYTFGFLNSLNGFIFNSHAGTGALGSITILLIWLTLSRTRTKYSHLLFVPLLAMNALSTETSYALFAFGICAITILAHIRKKTDKSQEYGMLLALAISIPIVAFQGGVITNRVMGILSGNQTIQATANTVTSAAANFEIMGFSLRWPPAIPNAHLGELSLINPYTLLAALLEIGLFVLVVPWVISFAWKKYRENDVYWGIVTITSILAFIIPIFIQYSVDRDITKIFSHAISTWKIQFLLFLWIPLSKIGWKGIFQKFILWFSYLTLVLGVLGGVVVTISNLSAVSQPKLSHRINSMDAYVASDTWGKLDQTSMVFDHFGWRASALTGLQTGSGMGNSNLQWNDINKKPTIEKLLTEGYRYVYIDKDWWVNLPASSRKNLSQSCVVTVTEYIDDWPLDVPDFRRLIDISNCAD